MNVEQEAQQAQTIAENKIRKLLYRYRGHIEEEDMDALLKIVDSQAQKIAEQAKEIERLKNALSTAEWHGEPDPLNMVAGGPGAPGYDGPI